MDNNSLAHSRYNCTYHIVFIPKYRRKVMFGELRKDVGEILGKVCRIQICCRVEGCAETVCRSENAGSRYGCR